MPRLKVALVCMPFNSCMTPSIQLGLLKPALEQRGFEARTLHLNLELARMVGFREYEAMSRIPLGDWYASYSLFGTLAPEEEFLELYSDTVTRILAQTGWQKDDLLRVRHQEVPRFLDWCMEHVPWETFDAVGFTSTFEQQIISLALARRIKERHPRLPVIFGGANCIEPMGREHLRAWPWIDHVCLGEGEEALPELLRRLEAGDLGGGVPGFLSRREGTIVDGGPPARFVDMETLPDPDYDEYFERVRAVGLDFHASFPDSLKTLPIETSRGCWWGAKNQCRFCGLPTLGLRYRSRSARAVVAQMDRLSLRYQNWTFWAVDDILDAHHVDELFGLMAREGYDYQLWYEVKSNLSPEQLRTMRNGGLMLMQPGIESLSSDALRRMRKGVRGLANVNTLKWAQYLGIRVQWNILSGFPGESLADYEKMVDTMRKIVHLQPPRQPPWWGTRILLTRYSPYFENPEEYPLSDVRPDPGYRHLYPEDRIDVGRIAYVFDYKMGETISDEQMLPVKRQIEAWRARWEQTPPPALFYTKGLNRIQVCDARHEGPPRLHPLAGQLAAIFEICQEKPRSLATICASLANPGAPDPDPSQVLHGLKRLLDLGILLEEDGQYLSIALPVHQNVEAHPTWNRTSPRT